MPYKNEILILGNLTQDSEKRYLPGENIPVCVFTIATTRPRKEKDKERPIYIDCEAWRNYGESVHEYLKKGSLVLVTGELDYKTWEKDGQKFSKHLIIAKDIQFLSKPKNNGADNLSEETKKQKNGD